MHVFTPERGGNGAALLWIHGGGFVIGAAKQDHSRCGRLAAAFGDRRRLRGVPARAGAPVPDAARRLPHRVGLAAADRERRRDRHRPASPSAARARGAGLAAALVLQVRDEGEPQPVAQWLFSPMLDDRTAADRSLDALEHFVWDNRKNRIGWTAYVGEPGGDGIPAYAAPARRDDFEGLPPTWIGAGDIELFREEDIAYAGALSAAGVDVVLDLVPGAPHGFETLVGKALVSVAYLARADAWLAGRLGLDTPPPAALDPR